MWHSRLRTTGVSAFDGVPEFLGQSVQFITKVVDDGIFVEKISAKSHHDLAIDF